MLRVACDCQCLRLESLQKKALHLRHYSMAMNSYLLLQEVGYSGSLILRNQWKDFICCIKILPHHRSLVLQHREEKRVADLEIVKLMVRLNRQTKVVENDMG